MTWRSLGVAPTGGVDWDRVIKSGRPADPATIWAAHGGWSEWIARYGRQGKSLEATWFPVLLEISENKNVVEFAAEVARAKWTGIIEIPHAYASPPEYLSKSRFCTAFVRASFFIELANPESGLWDWVRRYQLSAPISRREANNVDGPPQRADTPRDVPAVEGVIDDGLPFANASLRPDSGGPGTGIRYFWNQGDPRNTVRPNAPGFHYGTEYKAKDLVKWIHDAGHDEEAAYLVPRQVRTRRRATHGAAVLGLAHDPASALVCVQLPYATSVDTSGASLGVCALDGLRYIFARADAIASDCGHGPGPLTVTLSYGYAAGPHDGRSILEAAIDEMIEARRSVQAQTTVVIPAGNSRLSRMHARFNLRAKAPQVLDWRILPDDLTPSFVEIWFPRGATMEGVNITVQAPGAPASKGVPQGAGSMWVDGRKASSGAEAVAAIIFPRRPTGNPDRAMALVAAGPTRSLEGEALAPCGVWTITVSSVASIKGVHAWVQRDDAAFGFVRRGRQSFFDDPDYVRFDDDLRIRGKRGVGLPMVEDTGGSYVKRAGTLNAIATGDLTIVVGGFRESDGSEVPYSSTGDDSMRSPAVLACAASSAALPDILAGGTHSGSLVAVAGTSFAAAGVSRAKGKIPGTAKPVPKTPPPGKKPPVKSPGTPPAMAVVPHVPPRPMEPVHR